MTNDKKCRPSCPKVKSEYNYGRTTSTDSNILQNSESALEVCSIKSISVTKVRDAVQNAIENMGTKVKANDTCSEADYEDTSLLTNEQIKNTTSDDISLLNSIQEDSQISEYNTSEFSTQNYGGPTAEVAQQTSDYKLLCPTFLREDVNSPCLCSHFLKYNNLIHNVSSFHQQTQPRRSRWEKWLGVSRSKSDKLLFKNDDLYKINIDPSPGDHSPPRKLVFKLIDNIPPKSETKTTGTNTKVNKQIKHDKASQGIHAHTYTKDYKNYTKHKDTNKKPSMKEKDEEFTERIDIYYFDHGNSEYFRTTDAPPVIMTEYLAERTEHYTKKFWAQIFGTIHIGVSFVTSFILQLFRFILYAVIRPLTVGIVQLLSDYFIKPCLAVTFNGIIQPPMIFLYNFATSLRDLCQPIADSVGYFISKLAILIESFRLVQVVTSNKCNIKEEKVSACN